MFVFNTYTTLGSMFMHSMDSETLRFIWTSKEKIIDTWTHVKRLELRSVHSLYRYRTSRCSQMQEGIWFGDYRISSLLHADDVVLLSLLIQDLQRALGRFVAECEVAG